MCIWHLCTDGCKKNSVMWKWCCIYVDSTLQLNPFWACLLILVFIGIAFLRITVHSVSSKMTCMPLLALLLMSNVVWVRLVMWLSVLCSLSNSRVAGSAFLITAALLTHFAFTSSVWWLRWPSYANYGSFWSTCSTYSHSNSPCCSSKQRPWKWSWFISCKLSRQ